jgi:hypothetical protein
MANVSGQDGGADSFRIIYGFWIVVIGFAAALLALLIAVGLGGWKDAKDVTSVVSAITGVVGSLAGAFFGVHVGQAGKERADVRAQEAEKRLTTLAALAPPDIAERALNIR